MARVLIGSVEYKYKSAARDAIRAILYAYPIGATLAVDHCAFMCAVVNLHPEREAKIGTGIASIQVEQNEGSRGFWITR